MPTGDFPSLGGRLAHLLAWSAFWALLTAVVIGLVAFGWAHRQAAPGYHSLSDEPRARRYLRIAFGCLWIVDGLLQAQPLMPAGFMPADIEPQLQTAPAGSSAGGAAHSGVGPAPGGRRPRSDLGGDRARSAAAGRHPQLVRARDLDGHYCCWPGDLDLWRGPRRSVLGRRIVAHRRAGCSARLRRRGWCVAVAVDLVGGRARCPDRSVDRWRMVPGDSRTKVDPGRGVLEAV